MVSIAKSPNKSEKDVLLAENLINKMLITKLSQRYFSHLSEGEKQIVLIARALVKNPEDINPR
jgi:iron complex transport system ATP-binding protein